MADLTNTKPKDTYGGLLQVPNSNLGIDATLRTVQDGKGNSSTLKLSSTAVGVGAITDVETTIGTKVDKEDFTTLTFAASPTNWDTNNRQSPLAKLTATGSFTINMTNVKSGSSGTLIMTTNTASAVTITFDTDFTNKNIEGYNAATITTYTFLAGTGKEYFLNYICSGTTLYWNIIDPSTTNGVYASWTITHGGYSVAPTVDNSRYTLIGKLCHIYAFASANGTSNATTTTITLPVAAANTSVQEIFIPLHVDNGAAVAHGVLRTRVGSNVADLFASAAAAAWTASAAKRGFVYLNGTYETV